MATEDLRKIARGAVEADVKEPQRRRYIVNNSTVEKLGELLAANLRGLLMFRDELKGLLDQLDKPGNEGDRAFYLESWNGNGTDFTYDRIGRGTIDLPPPCLSILGAMTVGSWTSYVRRTSEGGERDDGLLQRFQLGVWPDQTCWENVDRWPDKKEKDAVYALFVTLDTLSAELPAGDWGDDEIPYIHFSDEAQEIFTEFHAELERRLRDDDEAPMMVAHLAKYRSLVPSLALLFSLADKRYDEVGTEYLLMACAWANYLESHARRLYSSAINPDLVGARSLLRRIVSGDLKDEKKDEQNEEKDGALVTFTLRDVYQHGWSNLATPEAVRGAAYLLEQYHWLRIERIKTGGRPTEVCVVNPQVSAKEGSI